MFSVVHKRVMVYFLISAPAIGPLPAQEYVDTVPASQEQHDPLTTADSAGSRIHPWQDEVTHENVLEEDFTRGWTLNRQLDQAIELQQRSDRMAQQSVDWRIAADQMDDPLERSQLQRRIMRAEDSVVLLREQAGELFDLIAESLPGHRPRSSPHRFLNVDTVIDGMTVYQYDLNDAFLALMDSADASQASSAVKKASGEQPGRIIHDPGSFQILETSPYSQNRPFEEDFVLPQGVFYRIQVAVFQHPPDPDFFGGLTPITTEAVPEKNLRRYFVGKFRRYEDANKALQMLRLQGYTDAFIVGYYNGQRGTFNKLRSLEKPQ